MIDAANRRLEVGISPLCHDQPQMQRSFANRFYLGLILTITGVSVNSDSITLEF
jgi:hypothetical protein